MIFRETRLKGSFIIEYERMSDERGFFARTFCQDEFEDRGLDTTIKQCNTSFNKTRGTLRGMHYQAAPKDEAKLVRCTRGKIYDVIIDLRADSDSYCKWAAFELDADNGLMLYIPKGFAHGFQTLEDSSEVFYQMSESYSADHARGVRWNDAAFGVEWPHEKPVMSERDRSFEDYRP